MSRVFGLIRDVVTASMFGDTAVGSAFAAAFAFPNLFRRLFGEGAISAAFVPMYATIVRDTPEDAGSFAGAVVRRLGLVTLGLTGVFQIAVAGVMLAFPDPDRSLSLKLMIATMPYMPLVCVAAILGSISQVHGKFGPLAVAPVILNLVVILAGVPSFFFDGPSPSAWAMVLSLSIVLAGMLQLLWCAKAVRGTGFKLRAKPPGDSGKELSRRLLPALIGLGTLQLGSFLDTVIAMWPIWFGPEMFGRETPLDTASNAILFYAQRLYQFPLGVFGIAIATVVFPALSAASNDPQKFTRTLAEGVRLSLFIAIPATIGLIFLAMPSMEVVLTVFSDAFSDDGVERASVVLTAYAIGLGAYSINQLLARVFYASGDTKTPMTVSIAMLAVNLAISLTLIWNWREAGLAIATVIAAWIQMIVLALLAGRKRLAVAFPWRSLAVSIGRTVVASGVMALMLFVLGMLDHRPESWAGQAAWLVSQVTIGGVVFLSVALVLRSPELQTLLPRGLRDDRSA